MNKVLSSFALFLGACFAVTSTFAATATELRDPQVFASSNHVLDLVIIAQPKQIQLGEFSPTAWVYTVCYRRDARGNRCPSDSRTAADYGGMRLQLEPGDHLKIRFVNELPPAPADAEHVSDPMGAMLVANPTNLHTHGLIVEPRQPSPSNPTYGDYVYVLAYPSGKMPAMAMPGLDVTDRPLDYDIYIPRNHPSGLFWLHPHVHGLALNQLSYGLAGLITVGSTQDYLTGPSEHAGRDLDAEIRTRYLTLKDMEIMPDGTVLSQEDPAFCAPDPDDEPARDGFCAGQKFVDDSGVHNYTGGKWFFTVNGQVHPTIHVSPRGEIWRITQASGSRTYQLSLQDSATGTPLVFQVLAVDGITLDSIGGPDTVAEATGGKIINAVSCPAALRGVSHAVCTNGLHMMPSARVEIWIPPMPGHSSAELLTQSFDTGREGDDWPSARLADVEFSPNSTWASALAPRYSPGRLLESTGLLGSAVSIDGGPSTGEIALQSAPAIAAKLTSPTERASLQEHLRALSAPEAIPSSPCASLPPGHRRRIFFGVPSDNANAFGAGYEEVDAKGRPVPGTFQDIAPFDHSVINVCLPLAEGNKTATETWELVNVSGEDHNFHIHQTKFRVLSTTLAAAPPNALMDNIPMLHGSDDCDGSIATWRSGACQVKSIYVGIPFSEVGDFVYHCHILEHEDGGMMAHIRVIPAR